MHKCMIILAHRKSLVGCFALKLLCLGLLVYCFSCFFAFIQYMTKKGVCSGDVTRCKFCNKTNAEQSFSCQLVGNWKSLLQSASECICMFTLRNIQSIRLCLEIWKCFFFLWSFDKWWKLLVKFKWFEKKETNKWWMYSHEAAPLSTSLIQINTFFSSTHFEKSLITC